MKMFLLGGLMFGSLIIAAVMLLLVSLGLVPVTMSVIVMMASFVVGALASDGIDSWESDQ